MFMRIIRGAISPVSTNEGDSAPLNVLIVEDEVFLAMELEAKIEALGQRVVGLAPDAEQAFAIAESAGPDLALVDVNLRDGLTGPRIASELVKKFKVIVVFVTGSAEGIPPDFSGALGVIPKPWAPKTIEQLIPFVNAYRSEHRPVLVSTPAHMQLAPAFQ